MKANRDFVKHFQTTPIVMFIATLRRFRFMQLSSSTSALITIIISKFTLLIAGIYPESRCKVHPVSSLLALGLAKDSENGI